MTQFSAATESVEANACSPGSSLYWEIAEFLYREAALLDNYHYADWLSLFASDVHYEMPVRTTEFLKMGTGFQSIGFFDENFTSLETRVKRLETGAAWAETPPSRTRHFVSNILVEPTSRPDEFLAKLCFMVTRTRADHDYQLFTGAREDTLRRLANGDFKIARRRILVDQTVITGTNLSIFF